MARNEHPPRLLKHLDTLNMRICVRQAGRQAGRQAAETDSRDRQIESRQIDRPTAGSSKINEKMKNQKTITRSNEQKAFLGQLLAATVGIDKLGVASINDNIALLQVWDLRVKLEAPTKNTQTSKLIKSSTALPALTSSMTRRGFFKDFASSSME